MKLKLIRARAPSTTVKNILGYLVQYEKTQVQAPGTTFSTFRDEVRLEGGHGNCCCFATFTEVHQGAHI